MRFYPFKDGFLVKELVRVHYKNQQESTKKRESVVMGGDGNEHLDW